MAKRVKPGDPKRAVALLRVSTKLQDNGPEVQRRDIELWAARAGVDVVAWHEETISGGTDLVDRPALLAALAALLEHGAGLLVTQKRDRLARDPLVAAMIELEAARLGARVFAADGLGNGDSAGDELMRGVLDNVSRFERRMIAARTRAALGAIKRRGDRAGALPFGYAVAPGSKRLVPEAREQGIIAAARLMRERGMSVRAITAELAVRGFVGRARVKNGDTFEPKPLRVAQVHALLVRTYGVEEI